MQTSLILEHPAMKRILVLLLLSPALLFSQVTGEYNLLMNKFNEGALNNIVPQQQWHKYPDYKDRAFWDQLSAERKTYFVQQAEKYLDKGWTFLPASTYMEYMINGNRSNYEAIVFERRMQLAYLLFGELVENKGRFMKDIADGIWAICEESTWCWPAHLWDDKGRTALPDVNHPCTDLGAAETGANLAWCYYLLNDKLDSIHPIIRQRIAQEVEKRVLIPFLNQNMSWMGFESKKPNNWNPWICSNYFASTLILIHEETKRQEYLKRGLAVLDLFINGYDVDGGCDEGPSYWGHAAGSMFDCLDLLHYSTNGKLTIFDQPIIKNMGEYLVKTHIDRDYFTNFADAQAHVKYQNKYGLIYYFGKSTGSTSMLQFAAYLKTNFEETDPLLLHYWWGQGTLNNLMAEKEMSANPTKAPYLRDVNIPSVGIMTARSKGGSSEGLFLAAQGGHNAESHNHNDVGNFVVYKNGLPFIIDIGVETYTAKTFSPERYSIWTMQSAYHNLPTLNGIMQSDGEQFRATQVNYQNTNTSASFELNLEQAYPDSANVVFFKRSLKLIRNKRVELTDAFAFTQVRSNLQFHLMSKPEPRVTAPGVLTLTNEGIQMRITFDPNLFEIQVEPISITDNRLKSNWNDKLYRTHFVYKRTPAKGNYTITFE